MKYSSSIQLAATNKSGRLVSNWKYKSRALWKSIGENINAFEGKAKPFGANAKSFGGKAIYPLKSGKNWLEQRKQRNSSEPKQTPLNQNNIKWSIEKAIKVKIKEEKKSIRYKAKIWGADETTFTRAHSRSIGAESQSIKAEKKSSLPYISLQGLNRIKTEWTG